MLISLEQKIVDRDKPKETIGFHIIKVRTDNSCVLSESRCSSNCSNHLQNCSFLLLTS